jgi:hypothetical protein
VAALIAFWLSECNGATVIWNEAVPLKEACDDVRCRPYQGLLSYAPEIEVIAREVPPTEIASQDQALQYLAARIWRIGEDKECRQCLDPESSNDALRIVSETFEPLGATHYGLEWLDRGKKVLVTLEACEAYGASDRGEMVLQAEVDVT